MIQQQIHEIVAQDGPGLQEAYRTWFQRNKDHVHVDDTLIVPRNNSLHDPGLLMTVTYTVALPTEDSSESGTLVSEPMVSRPKTREEVLDDIRNRLGKDGL